MRKVYKMSDYPVLQHSLTQLAEDLLISGKTKEILSGRQGRAAKRQLLSQTKQKTETKS